MNRSDSLTTHDLYRLDCACRLIFKAFDDPPYLVGSAGVGGTADYRDVDVRLILDDRDFDALFLVPPGRSLWQLLSLSIGAYLREATGLPIDFQIQRRTEANEKHSKPRNPLGMARDFAGLGDATPFGSDAAIASRSATARGQQTTSYCDECGCALAYGPTGIMRQTGRTNDGYPVVTILCHACAEHPPDE